MRKTSTVHIDVAFLLLYLAKQRAKNWKTGWESTVFPFGLEYNTKPSIIQVLFEVTVMRCLSVCACIASAHVPTCCGEVTISPEECK